MNVTTNKRMTAFFPNFIFVWSISVSVTKFAHGRWYLSVEVTHFLNMCLVRASTTRCNTVVTSLLGRNHSIQSYSELWNLSRSWERMTRSSDLHKPSECFIYGLRLYSHWGGWIGEPPRRPDVWDCLYNSGGYVGLCTMMNSLLQPKRYAPFWQRTPGNALPLLAVCLCMISLKIQVMMFDFYFKNVLPSEVV